MAQVLMDPFGNVREYPKEALCRFASYIFLHLRDHHGDIKHWWDNFGELYQGVTVAGRQVHGIEGSQHFYKRIPIKEETSDEESSDDDEEMNDADDERTESTSDEDSSFDDDETSSEPSSEPSVMSYDSWAPEFFVYPEIIIKQEDSDYFS